VESDFILAPGSRMNIFEFEVNSDEDLAGTKEHFGDLRIYYGDNPLGTGYLVIPRKW